MGTVHGMSKPRATPTTGFDLGGMVAAATQAPDVSKGFHVFRDGADWCAVGPTFESLATSIVGFGNSPARAVHELRIAAYKAGERFHKLPIITEFTVHG